MAGDADVLNVLRGLYRSLLHQIDEHAVILHVLLDDLTAPVQHSSGRKKYTEFVKRNSFSLSQFTFSKVDKQKKSEYIPGYYILHQIQYSKLSLERKNSKSRVKCGQKQPKDSNRSKECFELRTAKRSK